MNPRIKHVIQDLRMPKIRRLKTKRILYLLGYLLGNSALERKKWLTGRSLGGVSLLCHSSSQLLVTEGFDTSVTESVRQTFA